MPNLHTMYVKCPTLTYISRKRKPTVGCHATASSQPLLRRHFLAAVVFSCWWEFWCAATDFRRRTEFNVREKSMEGYGDKQPTENWDEQGATAPFASGEKTRGDETSHNGLESQPRMATNVPTTLAKRRNAECKMLNSEQQMEFSSSLCRHFFTTQSPFLSIFEPAQKLRL